VLLGFGPTCLAEKLLVFRSSCLQAIPAAQAKEQPEINGHGDAGEANGAFVA